MPFGSILMAFYFLHLFTSKCSENISHFIWLILKISAIFCRVKARNLTEFLTPDSYFL